MLSALMLLFGVGTIIWKLTSETLSFDHTFKSGIASTAFGITMPLEQTGYMIRFIVKVHSGLRDQGSAGQLKTLRFKINEQKNTS